MQRSGMNSAPGSTTDSGRDTAVASALTFSSDIDSFNRGSSSTPDDVFLSHDDLVNTASDDKSIRIRLTQVYSHKCYEQAFVSHIDHPSAFFLQLPHGEKEFLKLHERINAFYSKEKLNGTSPVRAWKRGDYCIAQYTDGQFYRARIIEILSEDQCGVVYLDVGNWDKVNLRDIYPIRREFSHLPAQAIPCTLAKALPLTGKWFDHPKATKLFKQLMFEQYVDATFHLKESTNFWPLCFVDLVLSKSRLNIREHMRENNLLREVNNKDICREFHDLLKPADYIIYSIPNEDDGHDDNDEDDGL